MCDLVMLRLTNKQNKTMTFITMSITNNWFNQSNLLLLGKSSIKQRRIYIANIFRFLAPNIYTFFVGFYM